LLAHSHRVLVLYPESAVADGSAQLLASELREALPDKSIVAVEAYAVVPAGIGVNAAGAACPYRYFELDGLRRLVEDDGVVACATCRPVAIAADGSRVRSDALLDNDAAAACLATELGADVLLLLTDVGAVYADWPGTQQRLAALDARQIGTRNFEPRAIGAKLRAAARFAATRGTFAMIGRATDAEALVAGRAGTRIDGLG
jgi:carbamate kinase